MSRNGVGTYSLPNPAFVAGTTISSTSVNGDLTDIASALTQSVSSDGQTTITGQLKFPSGTAAAPSHTFASDLTTGMYYIGSNHLGFSTGGVEIAAFNANNLGSGQNGNVLEINTSSGIAYPTPVGMVVDFAGTSAPVGWFLCFGQSLASASYPELFQVLGTTYGTSAGNVVLPDCRGRATYGKDNMGGSAANRITVAGGNFDGTVLGGTGGAQNSTILRANLPNINFTISGIALNDPGHTHTVNFGSTEGGSLTQIGSNFAGTITTSTATTGITISSQGVAASGGSGTALATLDPAIIFNKIIFAGRP